MAYYDKWLKLPNVCNVICLAGVTTSGVWLTSGPGKERPRRMMTRWSCRRRILTITTNIKLNGPTPVPLKTEKYQKENYLKSYPTKKIYQIFSSSDTQQIITLTSLELCQPESTRVWGGREVLDIYFSFWHCSLGSITKITPVT